MDKIARDHKVRLQELIELLADADAPLHIDLHGASVVDATAIAAGSSTNRTASACAPFASQVFFTPIQTVLNMTRRSPPPPTPGRNVRGAAFPRPYTPPSSMVAEMPDLLDSNATSDMDLDHPYFGPDSRDTADSMPSPMLAGADSYNAPAMGALLPEDPVPARIPQHALPQDFSGVPRVPGIVHQVPRGGAVSRGSSSTSSNMVSGASGGTSGGGSGGTSGGGSGGVSGASAARPAAARTASVVRRRAWQPLVSDEDDDDEEEEADERLGPGSGAGVAGVALPDVQRADRGRDERADRGRDGDSDHESDGGSQGSGREEPAAAPAALAAAPEDIDVAAVIDAARRRQRHAQARHDPVYRFPNEDRARLARPAQNHHQHQPADVRMQVDGEAGWQHAAFMAAVPVGADAADAEPRERDRVPDQRPDQIQDQGQGRDRDRDRDRGAFALHAVRALAMWQLDAPDADVPAAMQLLDAGFPHVFNRNADPATAATPPPPTADPVSRPEIVRHTMGGPDRHHVRPAGVVVVSRPGTCLTNCRLHLPQDHALVLATTCSLLDVRVISGGYSAPSATNWGYAQPAIVEIGGVLRHRRPQVSLTRVTVNASGEGNGVRVLSGDVSMQSCAVLELKRNAVVVAGQDAALTARHCVFSRNGASGLWALAAARVSLNACHLSDNACNGAAAWDTGTRLTARGCRISDNTMHGVRWLFGATGALSRSVVEDCGDTGAVAGNKDTSVTVSECLIQGCRTDVYVHRGAQARVHRCVLGERAEDGTHSTRLRLEGQSYLSLIECTHTAPQDAARHRGARLQISRERCCGAVPAAPSSDDGWAAGCDVLGGAEEDRDRDPSARWKPAPKPWSEMLLRKELKVTDDRCVTTQLLWC